MAYLESMAEFILDTLSEFEDISTKKMFGALAFYKGDVLFGAVMDDKFTLRAVAENESKYLSAGMIRHVVPGRKLKMPYFDVPIDVLEDRDALIHWVKTSYDDSKKLNK